MTTSKLRSRRLAASESTSALEAGVEKSVALDTMTLPLTIVALTTIVHSKVAPSSDRAYVDGVKVKVPAAAAQVASWMNLQQASRVIQGTLEEKLRAESDLSWAEFELLWRLRLADGHPLRMNEIAEQLLGSPSGTTRIVDRLEAERLIARETPRDNRRVVQVRLTERGRTRLAAADRGGFLKELRGRSDQAQAEPVSGHCMPRMGRGREDPPHLRPDGR